MPQEPTVQCLVDPCAGVDWDGWAEGLAVSGVACPPFPDPRQVEPTVWSEREVAAAMAWAATTEPGPGVVDVLALVDPARLSSTARVDFLVAAERCQAWLASLATRPLVASVGGVDLPETQSATGPVGLAHLEQAAAREDVRCALRLSDPAVRTRIDVARALTGPLEATAAALTEGRISWPQTRVLVEATAGHGDADAAELEAAVLPRVLDRDLAHTRRVVRRELARRDDPNLAAARHRRAVTRRGIRWWELPDGMACLQVTSSALDVATVQQALRVLSGPGDAADPRTRSARAVDTLVGLCLGAVAPAGTDDTPRPGPVRPPVHVQIVVDLATLAGLSANPAHIPGLGDIPADIARDWAADAGCWQRLVVDPVDDHLLDQGPLVHRPLPGLDRYVRTRDSRCQFPGCRQPALTADLDHRVPHRPDGSGGTTSAENLAALCRHHHRLKTHTRWRVRRLDDGTVEWTSPTGRTHRLPRRPLRE